MFTFIDSDHIFASWEKHATYVNIQNLSFIVAAFD